MNVESYLFFNGHCAEAVAFYEKAIDAKTVFRITFEEAPDPPPPDMIPANWGDKIMHTTFSVGETMVMASDSCGPESTDFKGFSLSLNVKTEEEADRYFAALSEGGEVTMPLGKTFWSPRFGMLKDKFGIAWMVGVVSEECPA